MLAIPSSLPLLVQQPKLGEMQQVTSSILLASPQLNILVPGQTRLLGQLTLASFD